MQKTGSMAARAARLGARGICFAKDYAHWRQNRHVQHGIELVGQIFFAVQDQGHSAVAQIEHRGALLAQVGKLRVGFGVGERDALPASRFRP